MRLALHPPRLTRREQEATPAMEWNAMIALVEGHPNLDLIVFYALASAALAVLGRVDVDEEVKVPVRYSVFVAPLHVALLWMIVPWLDRQWPMRTRRRLLEAGMFGCALMVLVQQVVAGQAAVMRTRVMVSEIERFVAGERDADMTKIIYPDLDQAQHAVDVIRSAGIYRPPR